MIHANSARKKLFHKSGRKGGVLTRPSKERGIKKVLAKKKEKALLVEGVRRKLSF